MRSEQNRYDRVDPSEHALHHYEYITHTTSRTNPYKSSSSSPYFHHNALVVIITVDMSLPLPIRTTILIVGAGPVGISLAIALSEQGVNDFVIVDKLEHTANTSRAFSIHAATMEVRHYIQIALFTTKRLVFGADTSSM